ncbi:MAG: polysaccharide biosynthesis C-terminal domain-containing protein [Erysipelotrichaceae bacterium]|nr:polysaccharide biosynthesis C-terminal domain-containing protein [Erysipelotrichaceae bacterium]
MKKSRTQRAFLNVATSIASEFISLACGLILPRLILSNYGSAYNGITQSISQFISYISLMKAGIGGATAVALYKPLAEKDNRKISEVLAATEDFMRKIALIFAVFVLVFSCVYPLLVSEEFGWLFTASLVLIISISTFGQYYFGFTYQMLLSADQKDYITTCLNILTTIVNTILSVILIRGNHSIHVIKLGSSLAHLITPLSLYFYVRKKYDLIKDVKPNKDLIPQRWDATAHEVASFINNNTDVVLLTFFTNMSEISVYSVYHYVISNLKKIVTQVTVGFGAAFGDMYARNEIELMHQNLGIFELIIYSFTSILYSVCFVMIIPFVVIYTSGVTDIEYIRPYFALVTVLASIFNCFRIPYRVIVINVGHYKQTKNGAIFEAVLNIVVSVLGCIRFGLIGVAMGTLCAMVFRTLQYAVYLSKNIMYRDLKYFIRHVVLTFAIMAAVWLISKLYMPVVVANWFSWICYAVLTTIIAIILTIGTDYLFYKDDLMNLIGKLKRNFLKRK